MVESRIPFLITCAGVVCSKPRLVRRQDPVEPNTLFEFVFKFQQNVDSRFLEAFPNSVQGTEFEDRARSLIENENVYTDKEGQIHFFKKPDHKIWWIEMVQTTIKKGKPYDVVTLEEAVNERAAD